MIRVENDSVPPNVPAPLSSFVGRERELADVAALLDERRLVTLSGPGGSGKTRLAARLAGSAAGRRDGVVWVDLGAVTDPALVARSVVSAAQLMLEPTVDPGRSLVSQLRSRHMLVCLDTCEHVIGACAELVDAVLRQCVDVSVLATSREPLGVPGEAVWRVPPLAADEAARLFVERAALVHPPFAGVHEPSGVDAVCARLDGIPLAIELAAAWTRVLSVEEITARLDDRFQLLVGGPRTVAERHRTLEASITWSHDLLDEPDRALFRRLAVFSGGFNADAVAAVCLPGQRGERDVLTAIGRLVDKSLVVVDPGPATRYRLLDTIAEYAGRQLDAAGEADAVRDRHLDHFLAFAEVAEAELERDHDRWRGILDTEHDNMRAALRWGLVADDPTRGRRLAAALARFWNVKGHVEEGIAFLEHAVRRAPDERSVLQASLLSGIGLVAANGGKPAAAGAAAQQGLEIAAELGDDRSRGRCLTVAAYTQFFSDFDSMHQLATEARRIALIADDPVALDMADVMLASAFANRDRHDEAVRLARPLAARARERGARSCAAFALGVDVWAHLFAGDLAQAESIARDGLDLATPLGDFFTVGYMTYNLAWVIGLSGRIDEAGALIGPIVRAASGRVPQVDLRAWFALMPARLSLWTGDLEGAAGWYDAAARFAPSIPDNWVVAQALPGTAETRRRQQRFDEAKCLALRALKVGERLDLPHVQAEALDELAHLVADTDPGRADRLHHQALAMRRQHGMRTFYVDSLEAIAGVSANAQMAARLVGATDVGRARMGYPRPPMRQLDHDAVLARLRDDLGDDLVERLRTEGAQLSLDDAVAYATRMRGERRRSSSGWASLTPTESDVAGLVADGMSNPEIGARLFMSRSTVKTHLSHVFAKLGVANRTELATYVARHAAAARPQVRGTSTSA